MRRSLGAFVRGIAAVGALGAGLLAAPPSAGGAGMPPAGPKALRHELTRDLGSIGGLHGAYVVDLTMHKPLFAVNPRIGRIPASVQKLYTTSTALLRLGPAAVLSTSVVATGYLDQAGTWHGTLYLHGGGDPTLGSASFDRVAYGPDTGTTMGALARALRNAGVYHLDGRIVGDESKFDSLRGTAATGFRPSFYLEGQLSALAYDRGFSNPTWTAFQPHPALYAARMFAAALRAVGVKVPARVPITTGRAPTTATLLASVNSPRLATLLRLTNTPSDNFLAETLLKDLGASLGGAGTTAAGAAVVRREIATAFGIEPRFDDGSGLSRYDSTTPHQVVTLLEDMAGNATFVNSLAIGGETGTLADEMRGTRAEGNCRGKTGTLYDVASLVGYCTGRDGHKLAFAFLLNGLSSSDYGHLIEAKMAVALANYDG